MSFCALKIKNFKCFKLSFFLIAFSAPFLELAADDTANTGTWTDLVSKVPQAKIIFSPIEWKKNEAFKTQASDLFTQIQFYPLGQPSDTGYKLYGKASNCATVAEIPAPAVAPAAPANPNEPPSFEFLKAQANTLVAEIEKEQAPKNNGQTTNQTVVQQKQQQYLKLLDHLMSTKQICRVEKQAPYGCLLAPVKFESFSTEKTEAGEAGTKISPLEAKLVSPSTLPGDGTKKIAADAIKGAPLMDALNYLAQPENKEAVEGHILLRSSAALASVDQCCLNSSLVQVKAIGPKLENACFEVACRAIKNLQKNGTRITWWTNEYSKLLASSNESKDFASAWRALKKCGLNTLPEFKLRTWPTKKLNVVSLIDHAAYNEAQIKNINEWYNKLALMVLKKEGYENNKPSNHFILGLLGESEKAQEMLSKVPQKSSLIDFNLDISRSGLSGTEMDFEAKEQKKGPNNTASQLVSMGIYDLTKLTFQIPAQPKNNADFLKILDQAKTQLEFTTLPAGNKTVVALMLGNADNAIGFNKQKLAKENNKKTWEEEITKIKNRRQQICTAFQKLIKAKEGLQVNIYQTPLAKTEMLSTISDEESVPAYIERNGVLYFSDLSNCLNADNTNVRVAFDQDWIEGADQMAWLHHFLLSP